MEAVSIQQIYADARSKGKREYNTRKAKGLSGHLTSLDGLIKDLEIISTVDIGIREIPLKKIRGTNSNFRRMTFSKNFLPLEDANSEFAGKWMSLCQSHLEEGIRDPIKVYEYMNFFYVIEGNKRVSVLKYYDASSIRAQILRLIPKYNHEDQDIRRYYKFLDFYKLTNMNQIWLTHEDDYNLLAELLVAFEPELGFYEDKYLHFYHFVYMPFRRIFKAHGGDELKMTTGDAFLLYARIYDIPDRLDEGMTQEIMPNLIKELFNRNLKTDRSIQTDSENLEKSTLMGAFNRMGNRQMKIAFIYAKSIASSGWSRSHELARLKVDALFGKEIETSSFENVKDDDVLSELIEKLVADGYNAIFTTAAIHRKVTLSAALLHNQVKFFNCSGSRPYVHMSSYYGKSFETRFLTGLVAGAMTESDMIGYTANEPSAENISCINAFAMGAKMVNPQCAIKVIYTGVWNSPEENEKQIRRLIEMGADLIASKNNLLSRDRTKDFGMTSMLCRVDKASKTLKDYVAAPIWHWEVFYEKIITSLMNGSYARILRTNREKKLLNFWWGLETGGIDVFLDENLIPPETLKLVKLMKGLIISDQFKIFYGPVFDNHGEMRVGDDQILSEEAIIDMDWYVDHVDIIE